MHAVGMHMPSNSTLNIHVWHPGNFHNQMFHSKKLMTPDSWIRGLPIEMILKAEKTWTYVTMLGWFQSCNNQNEAQVDDWFVVFGSNKEEEIMQTSAKILARVKQG